MKWAKTKSEFGQIHSRLKGLKEMNYYDQIKDGSTLMDLKKQNFGIWRAFKKVELEEEYTTPEARARYEIFIGGFLYYFENHVKESGKVSRTLYFDWGEINQKFALTIFLKPFYHNPLQTGPTNTNSDINSNGNGNGNGKYNGFVNKQEEFDVLRNKPVVKMQKTTIAPPPALTDTDPPPPPPPPPPPRE